MMTTLGGLALRKHKFVSTVSFLSKLLNKWAQRCQFLSSPCFSAYSSSINLAQIWRGTGPPESSLTSALASWLSTCRNHVIVNQPWMWIKNSSLTQASHDLVVFQANSDTCPRQWVVFPGTLGATRLFGLKGVMCLIWKTESGLRAFSIFVGSVTNDSLDHNFSFPKILKDVFRMIMGKIYMFPDTDDHPRDWRP